MNFVILSSHFHEGSGTPPHAAASRCLLTQITLCVHGVGARRADDTSTQSDSDQITLGVCAGEKQIEQITLGVCAGEEQVMQITLCVRGVGARCADDTITQR